MGPDFLVIDLETTGDDPRRHEIIEIGALRVSSDLQAIHATYETKVRPEHPEIALPEALAVNGYAPELWHDALPLREAMDRVLEIGKACVLAAYNVTFDWSFLQRAMHRFSLVDTLNYHRFDVFSLAYEYALRKKLGRLDLQSLCDHFSIERPRPHRALADAKAALEVWRRIRKASS